MTYLILKPDKMKRIIFIFFLLVSSFDLYSQNKTYTIFPKKPDSIHFSFQINYHTSLFPKYSLPSYSLKQEDKVIALYYFHQNLKKPDPFLVLPNDNVFTGWFPTSLFILRQFYLSKKGKYTFLNAIH